MRSWKEETAASPSAGGARGPSRRIGKARHALTRASRARRGLTDSAVSPVVATILLVALAVILSAGVYSTASLARSEKPTALSLTPATQTGTTRTLTIAAATPGMPWSVVALTLDGVTLDYDGALTTDDTWCKLDSTGICIATGAWDATDHVVAGDQLRVAHASIGAKVLRLRDTQANLLLSTMQLR